MDLLCKIAHNCIAIVIRFSSWDKTDTMCGTRAYDDKVSVLQGHLPWIGKKQILKNVPGIDYLQKRVNFKGLTAKFMYFVCTSSS